MKLLITGGTGFVGSRLAFHAQAQGHEVVVTGLLNNAAENKRHQELKAAGIQTHIAALQDEQSTRALVGGCDAVIHLAAAQHEANVPDAYFHTANVEATRVLLEACSRAGVRRFVYGSTIGVYGSMRTEVIDETTITNPTNIYGRTKLQAEVLVRTWSDRLETTIIRISEVYGPGDLRLLKLFRAIHRKLFLLIGSGSNQRQPIHVSDLVCGLLLAATHPAAPGQTFILAGPTPITTKVMVEQISAALNRSSYKLSVPLWPFLMAATIMETLLSPLGIQPPLHRRRLDFFRKSFCFSTAKAKSLLNFEAVVSFAEGARDTALWYRDEGLLKSNVANEAAQSNVPVAPAATPHQPWQHTDVLEYTQDAIIIWEMNGEGILYWNRAAEHLYGYTRQEALGRTTHLLLETQVEEGIHQMEEVLARYGVWIGNLRHKGRAGNSVLVQARLAVLSQRNGRWIVVEVNRSIPDTLTKDDSMVEEAMASLLGQWRHEE